MPREQQQQQQQQRNQLLPSFLIYCIIVCTTLRQRCGAKAGSQSPAAHTSDSHHAQQRTNSFVVFIGIGIGIVDSQ